MENSAILRTENEDMDIISQDDETSKGIRTLKELLGPVWKEYFCREETIRHLLDAVEITDEVYQGIQDKYAINDDRFAMVIWMRNRKTRFLSRMIIDVVMGEPTWKQMMDVTFDIGDGCNPKIVVYDSAVAPGFGIEWRVAGFARINSDCGFTTFILAGEASSTGIKFTPQKDERFYGPPNLKVLPSKKEFQQTEFAFYVDYFVPHSFNLEKEYLRWPCDGLIWELDGFDMELTYPVWKENGVFILLESISPQGRNQLKWLLDNKAVEMEKTVGPLKVENDPESDLPNKIFLRVWDRPFTEFLFAEEHKKCELAARILDMNKADKWFFENILKGCPVG